MYTTVGIIGNWASEESLCKLLRSSDLTQLYNRFSVHKNFTNLFLEFAANFIVLSSC